MAEGGRVVALIAVQGNLATPRSRASRGPSHAWLKSTDGAAVTLAKSAPPPPYASGVAVVLLFGDVAHVATTGGARCYRERDGVLEELAAGVHDAKSGDAFVAASHASLRVGQAFFTTQLQAASDAEFRNDTLDAALESALARPTRPSSQWPPAASPEAQRPSSCAPSSRRRRSLDAIAEAVRARCSARRHALGQPPRARSRRAVARCPTCASPRALLVEPADGS